MSEDGCTECLREEAHLAPMLHDEVWARLADKDETLCTDCFFERMVERDVNITVADLRPCLFNLLDSPLSWFDVLMKDETKPPANMGKWREAYVELQDAPGGHGTVMKTLASSTGGCTEEDRQLEAAASAAIRLIGVSQATISRLNPSPFEQTGVGAPA